jgi:hypothetical protein
MLAAIVRRPAWPPALRLIEWEGEAPDEPQRFAFPPEPRREEEGENSKTTSRLLSLYSKNGGTILTTADDPIAALKRKAQSANIKD